MQQRRVVVLGGGLAGLAVAYGLAEEGWTDISILESGRALGGLAGSFERDGRFYPLGYHHILSRDRILLFFLDVIGALPSVRWRKIRMLFEAESGLYDLSHPIDFVRFPMPWISKLRFVRLMVRALAKSNWSDWRHQSAASLLDAWADPTVRRMLFDPLVQLKFRLSCCDISAEWLGMRLSYREGSAALGYIPGTNWTTVLCHGMESLARDRGVRILTGAGVTRLNVMAESAVSVTLNDGLTMPGDVFVSTVPVTSFLKICRDGRTPHLESIRYTALLSMVCSTAQKLPEDFYWLNLATRKHAASGLFNLSALNPTIGQPHETCLNFVTHLSGTDDPLFNLAEDDIIDAYLADFRRIFRWELRPSWVKLSKIPVYSPVFVKDYASPPVKSLVAPNIYFAGNYCGGPSIASTGSALASGIETARQILNDHGVPSSLHEKAARFRRPLALSGFKRG